jgi:hypothetical protein
MPMQHNSQKETGVKKAELFAELPIKMIAGLGFAVTLWMSFIPSRPAYRHNNHFAGIKEVPAGSALARPAWRDIVPSEVIDPSAAVFIGTGDQSNGVWTHP